MEPKYEDKIIVGSVDYLHPISGIEQKLRAVQLFLHDNPKRRKNFLLIQYAVPVKTVSERLMKHEMFAKSIERIK